MALVGHSRRREEMTYNTWSKKDRETLRMSYPDASKEKLMAAIPSRTWKQICQLAHYYGLHRSFVAKGEAIRRGKRR